MNWISCTVLCLRDRNKQKLHNFSVMIFIDGEKNVNQMYNTCRLLPENYHMQLNY